MTHINIGQKYSNLCKGVVYTKLNSVSAFTSVFLIVVSYINQQNISENPM